MRRILNVISIVLGFVSLGLGMAGLVLPVLPTAPFLILASFLFAKSSEKFHKWLISTSMYKKHIETLVTKKEMTQRAKVSVLSFATAVMAASFILVPLWYVRIVIVAVAACHYYYFLVKIKTK